jgi:hypothetical protein
MGLVPLGVGVWPLRVDECGEGLSCLDARCVETPQTNQHDWIELGEGEPCGPTYVGFCQRANLYCDPSERLCREKQPLGGTCSHGGCEGCLEGGTNVLHCEGASGPTRGTCAPLPRVGDPCDPLEIVECGTCDTPAWCDPASSTCVEGLRPLLCRQLFIQQQR